MRHWEFKTIPFLAIAFFFCFVSPLPAAEEMKEPPPLSKENTKKMGEDLELIQKKNEEFQRREMERIEAEHPDLYESRKAVEARQKRISEIATSFHQNTISAQEAEQQLTPLIKEELRSEISQLDRKISALEKKLDFLKQAKRDPNLLVEKRMDELLGQTMPSPEELMD